MLEVSSPGIDRPAGPPGGLRPFRRARGAYRSGEPAVDGRKRFRGRVLGRDGDHVRLAAESGEVRLPLDEIARAKLVLNDELLALARASPARRIDKPDALTTR